MSSKKKLTAVEVANLKTPGMHRVDEGLYLQFENETSRSWIHRYMFLGKPRRSGLGSYPEVSLREA